jgi:hypothetical protein
MKNQAKWFLIGLITIFLISSMTLSTAFAQELATETNTVEATMASTSIAGYYTDSSIQVPPSIPTPTTVTPRNVTLDLMDYSLKENVTLYSNPQAIVLKTAIGPLGITEYKSPTSQKMYIQNTTQITYTLYGGGGSPSNVLTKDGNYWWWTRYIMPTQPARIMYQANFTLNWDWDFYVNAKWLSLTAMKVVNSIPPLYLDYTRLTAYNWINTTYDRLSANVSHDVWTDGYYTLNHTKYINPLTRNCIIQIESGEGQNSSYSLLDIKVDYIAVYTDTGSYTCHNATGYWQSNAIMLPAESDYQYNNITVSYTNASYEEGIDQFQINSNFALLFGEGNVFNVGQSFRPIQNNYFKILVEIGRIGNPIFPVEMTIYEAKNDLPIGPVLASAYILPEQLNPAGMNTPINFTIRYHFNTSKSYIFTVQVLGPPDPVNYYGIRYTNAGDFYPPGKMSFNNGVWIVEPTNDLSFKTYFFMESIVTLGYRTSAEGETWSEWSSASFKADTWALHNFTLNIQQNKTQYFQIQLNLTSNSPAHLPNVSSVILDYYSYERNYTISEFDEFTYSKIVLGVNTVYKVSINIGLVMNAEYMPEDGWIRIYNIASEQWDYLRNGLGGGLWALEGANLTDYYNGSLYILFYYFSYLEPIVGFEKEKSITFDWRYYIYDETDVLDFNAIRANYLTINTTYAPIDSTFVGNLSYLQNDSQWILLASSVENLNVSLALAGLNGIPTIYFNNSFTVRTIIYSHSDTPINKTIGVTIFYEYTPPMNWSWIVWVGIGGVVGLIVYGAYSGYKSQGRTVKEIIVFS